MSLIEKNALVFRNKMSEKRTRKLPVKKFHKTFDLDGVPFCLKWSVEDVADWVEIELEFPQYKVDRLYNMNKHAFSLKLFVMCLCLLK